MDIFSFDLQMLSIVGLSAIVVITHCQVLDYRHLESSQNVQPWVIYHTCMFYICTFEKEVSVEIKIEKMSAWISVLPKNAEYYVHRFKPIIAQHLCNQWWRSQLCYSVHCRENSFCILYEQKKLDNAKIFKRYFDCHPE